MADISPTIAIISVNVLNIPIKDRDLGTGFKKSHYTQSTESILQIQR